MNAVFRGFVLASALLAPLAVRGATAPYAESFEGYATGDTAVVNFTELSSLNWGIVSPSYSGKAYENGISATSASAGFAAGTGASSTISFPALASASFSMSTTFRIDLLTVAGTHPQNAAAIGLTARSVDAIPASTSADRYDVSYFLEDDGLGHGTGRLWLHEVNLFFGDSLNELSASTLTVAPGDIYKLTLSGVASGPSLALSATLTNLTTSAAISVSDVDGSNLVAGSNFGYINYIRVVDVGTVSLNADFDDFSMVPEPTAQVIIAAMAVGALTFRPRFSHLD